MKLSPLIRDYEHKKKLSLLLFFLSVLEALFFLQTTRLVATPAEMTAIDPVQVTDAGNQGDPSAYGWGAVLYEFWIGKNDVTVGEYAIFLNAVAQKDTLHLYDARMWSDRWQLIQRSGPDAQGNFHYQANAATSRYPIIFTTYKNAQRYCNWLENGKPNGDEVAGITETGTYDLTSLTTTIAVAKKQAAFRLPTNDEYHKVTYYKGGSLSAGFYKYPTQTDELPQSHLMDLNGAHNVNVGLSSQGIDGRNFLQNVGNTIHLAIFSNEIYDGCNPHSIGFYGTHDDGCNVAQWTSTTDSSGSFLLVRGADWDYWDHNTNIWDPFYYAASTSLRIQTPDTADEHVGFRVVMIDQEPSRETKGEPPTAPPSNPPSTADPTSSLNPQEEKEFQAARDAYISANQTYHEANDQFLNAYKPYKDYMDFYIPFSISQKIKSETLLQAYQQYGLNSPEWQQARTDFEIKDPDFRAEWPNEQQILSNMITAMNIQSEAEQSYLQSQSLYLTTCQQINHQEDDYDKEIDQYNTAVKKLIDASKDFFAKDNEWNSATADYRWANYVFAIGLKQWGDEPADQYLSSATEKYQLLDPLRQKAFQHFVKVRDEYYKSQNLPIPF
jgi:hypothetical protein